MFLVSIRDLQFIMLRKCLIFLYPSPTILIVTIDRKNLLGKSIS